MLKKKIAQLLQIALTKAPATKHTTVNPAQIIIETTKNQTHGDFSSNIALILAKTLGKPPQEIAMALINHLPTADFLQQVVIAGPGFLNFFLTPATLYEVVPLINTQQQHFGLSTIGAGKTVVLEFLSSNPTGPLHVGHGRHAVFGDVMAKLFQALGYKVHKEYYLNDTGRQMDIVTISVWFRYLELQQLPINFPANCYRGAYVRNIAQQLHTSTATHFLIAAHQLPNYTAAPATPTELANELELDFWIAQAKLILQDKYQEILHFALQFIVADMQQDLEELGICYDNWFAESTLSPAALQQTVALLHQHGHTYQKNNALWFRSSNFQDDKDRVLIRANGKPTYFANDVAYHLSKFSRGFTEAVDIIGADHHGYIPRVRAAMQACAIAPQRLTFVELQNVSLYRGKTKIPMSTRRGDFVTLRELRQEVGNDVARFFYINCKHKQHIDFDLELAKSKSNDNPVYYVQYAHARICSIFRALAKRNLTYDSTCGVASLALLTAATELELLRLLASYPETIIASTQHYEPYFLSNYLRNLASCFHTYYNSYQLLLDNNNLMQARLSLASAIRQVLNNGLNLLGITAPENM